MLGAIRRVFHPGCRYEEILCLVGGQGIGKSTLIRFLAMADEWFSDDIRRLDDDKIFQRLVGHWIIEMSEMLATNNAKSVEESRSFFSRQKDTYRVPYESQPRDRQRQCVFAGTSNSMDFLPLDRARVAAFRYTRSFGARYGKQKGWERVSDADDTAFIVNQPQANQLHFTQITSEEALAQGMPPEFLRDDEGKLTA